MFGVAHRLIQRQQVIYLHSFTVIAKMTEDGGLKIRRGEVQSIGNAAQFIHLLLESHLWEADMINLACRDTLPPDYAVTGVHTRAGAHTCYSETRAKIG